MTVFNFSLQLAKHCIMYEGYADISFCVCLHPVCLKNYEQLDDIIDFTLVWCCSQTRNRFGSSLQNIGNVENNKGVRPEPPHK